MTDIMVALPDNLGNVSFPAGTPHDVITRETANAYLMAKGKAAGKADGKNYDAGLSQAVGTGITQGFGDELTAGVRAALPGVSNWMMRGPNPSAFGAKPDAQGFVEPTAASPFQTVSSAPTFDERYTEELGRERGKKEAFAQENPWSAGLGTAAGAAIPIALGAMAGVPVAPTMGSSMPWNIAKASLTGAGYGGLYGFGEGEGGLSDRLESGGKGAGFGALMGPAFYGAGKGAGALWDWAKTTGLGQSALNGVQNVAGALDRLGSVKPRSVSAAAPDGGVVPGENPMTYAADQLRSLAPTADQAVKDRAIQYLATAVERGRMTPEQAQAELTKLGVDATLADVNKSLFRTTRMTNTLQGQSGDLAESVMTERQRTYNPRLRKTIEGENPPPEDFYFRGDLPGGNIPEKYAREVGQRAYGAMDAAGFKNSPVMSRMIEESPPIEGAVNRVLTSLQDARKGTDRSPESLVEVMHMVKREIQNIGLDANGRPSSTAYHWQETANDFVRALKSANPELAAADRAYAAAKSVPEHYRAGLGVFEKGSTAEGSVEKSSAAVANMLKVADAAQGNATEFGAINAGRAKTGGNAADAIGLARTIDQSDEARKKIVSIFGETRAKEIFSSAETVMRFHKTASGLMSGSQTADKAAEIFAGPVDFGNAGLKVSGGGIAGRAFESANDMIRRIAAPNEAVRNQMGQMLLNRSAADNQQTLAAVAEALRRRNAGRQLSSAIGGVGGAPPFALSGSQP